jgi:hypothetical protein
MRKFAMQDPGKVAGGLEKRFKRSSSRRSDLIQPSTSYGMKVV